MCETRNAVLNTANGMEQHAMKRLLSCHLLAVAVALCAAAVATAQGYAPARPAYRPQPLRRPTVSPYLNLVQFQDTADPSIPVYQTLVRPFVDQRRINQYQVNQVYQLQQQVTRSASETARGGDSVRQTGHYTSYQNLSHYFPSFGRRTR